MLTVFELFKSYKCNKTSCFIISWMSFSPQYRYIYCTVIETLYFQNLQKSSNAKLVICVCLEHIYRVLKTHFTVDFNLGEDIGSWVVFKNMKKIVQIVPISVYLRRKKITYCYCHYWTTVYCNSQVALEIQQHVRIRTFVGSIWIIELPHPWNNWESPETN